MSPPERYANFMSNWPIAMRAKNLLVDTIHYPWQGSLYDIGTIFRERVRVANPDCKDMHLAWHVHPANATKFKTMQKPGVMRTDRGVLLGKLTERDLLNLPGRQVTRFKGINDEHSVMPLQQVKELNPTDRGLAYIRSTLRSARMQGPDDLQPCAIIAQDRVTKTKNKRTSACQQPP
jgi:hypothetical protein